jgi:hypothetical protein
MHYRLRVFEWAAIKPMLAETSRAGVRVQMTLACPLRHTRSQLPRIRQAGSDLHSLCAY